MRPLQKIGLILILLVLLPAMVLLAGRLYSLSKQEAMIEEIYDQQLQTMLFAVNQHAWDVADTWASRLDRALEEEQSDTAAARSFLASVPSVRAVFFADTSFTDVRLVLPGGAVSRPVNGQPNLEDNAVRQLVERRKGGYRQLLPFTALPDTLGTTVALAFVSEAGGSVALAGLLLDAEGFINVVLTPRLQDLARERFVAGIFARGRAEPVFATAPLLLEETRQQRALWLFEDYVLGIRLSAGTVEEVLQIRFYRELAFLLLLAAVLLAGTWMLYRNVRREVELARIKSDFVSNVSHELRTPLAMIRMYAETLEMGRVQSDDQRHRYYRVISQESLRLTNLINNILHFSHIESGGKRYRLAPTDLNEVVRDVVERYAFTLDQQAYELDIRLDDALPSVSGDTGAMAEALINLIDNAVKYGGAANYIGITTGRGTEGVFVAVEDRGDGIPAEEHEKIFDAFYRAASSLVHDTKGTGLGLALVRHIMAAHGGAVTVDSRPGRGSRFHLYFRAAEPLHRSSAAPSS